MRLRPKILDFYLGREFLVTFLGVVGVCALVLLIAKVFEEFDEVIENNVSLTIAAKYFLLILPFRLLEVVPLATVLAVIFSMGGLARNRELLAVTASGQSPYRSALPVLVSTIAITGVMILLNETFVPRWQAEAERLENVEIKMKTVRSEARRRNIFEKGVGNTFFMMRAFDSRTDSMEDVLIFEQSEDPRIWRYSLKAKLARLVERRTGPNRDTWEFSQVVEHFYDDQGRPERMKVTTGSLRLPMEAGLDEYLATRKEPEEMNLTELTRYIHTLRMRGEDVSMYMTDWYLKLVFPFSTVFLGMIAFALALRAHTASLALAFGVGVFLTMLFYALAAVGQTLGHIGILPAPIAAFGPPVVFLSLGIYMVRRSGFAA